MLAAGFLVGVWIISLLLWTYEWIVHTHIVYSGFNFLKERIEVLSAIVLFCKIHSLQISPHFLLFVYFFRVLAPSPTIYLFISFPPCSSQEQLDKEEQCWSLISHLVNSSCILFCLHYRKCALDCDEGSSPPLYFLFHRLFCSLLLVLLRSGQ